MLLNEAHQLNWIHDLYRLAQSDLLANKTNELFESILQHIVQGFHADTGSLALRQEEGGALTIVAGIGLPAECIGSAIAHGNGIIGWVVENGKPLLLKGDVVGDPRFCRPTRREQTPVPSSALCWPLQLDNRIIGALSVNRIIGVLSVNSLDEQAGYTEADLEFGCVLVNLITLVIDNANLHHEKQQRIEQYAETNEHYMQVNQRLQTTLDKLQKVQHQLIQSEKMASVGQLAAGVAHEINNPIGYINSNLTALKNYIDNLLALVEIYEKAEATSDDTEQLAHIKAFKQKIDLEYLKTDVLDLLEESQEGTTRVKKIIQDLKDFSHLGGDDDWQWTNLHAGLESTLNIANNEIKYKAQIIKEFGDLPEVRCLPHQLNQVFMNLLINAAHAIEKEGIITLRTGTENDYAWVEISDTGKGIAPEHQSKIFDPFFTTKPVGKGTGLGLSVSYAIIKKHQGEIQLTSQLGQGTTFRIILPIAGAIIENA
ncbi:MAG: ATP-binding protein [Methylobacter sp.]|nr:ATP-binding protein [Methylobacter sp.]